MFKKCPRRKLLSLILIGLIVEGFIGFININIIHVFGQPSITLKWRANAGTGSTWMGPLAADLNNDGLMEIVINGGNGIAALNPINGKVIWSKPYTASHGPCEIIDLNKDSIPEILFVPDYVNGTAGGGVLALHGNNGSVYWYNRRAAGDDTYIAVADINADGYPEIYSVRPGLVTALTHDGRIFASTYTYYSCWGGMSIGDTDFDGVFEVYLGERSSWYPPPSSPGRGLRAFWADNLTERWAYPDILCSSQAPVLADVDKDGDLEIIILNQRGGVAVFNTDGSVNTYKGVYRYDVWVSYTYGGTTGLTAHSNAPVADLDGDGNLELITNGDANHNPYPPKIWDLVDWKLDATLPFPSMEPPGVADIDGDGKSEIINCNQKNVTIFKYNAATTNYDIIYTIPLDGASPFSIAQDIDGDGKLELVFDQYNSWVSVYDVEAPAPTPLPRSGLYFYSQYRTRVPVYVPPPELPPKIAGISPNDGATNIPVTLSQLSFKLTDYQSKPMNYTVTTNPNIGGPYSGINVPNGGKITIPVSGLARSTTYTWTVKATDGTYNTTRTFTFYTEGNVVLTISKVGDGSVVKNPDSATYAYGARVQLTAVADNVVYTFSNWDGDLAWVGNHNPVTILMDGNKTAIAVFTKIEYMLRINVSPTGSGSVNVNKTAPYYYGDVVKLTAVPNAGWSFSYWSIANMTFGGPPMSSIISTQNPATIIMDNNKMVTAVFVEIPAVQYDLVVGVSGMGTTIPAAGSYLYDAGSVVDVTAVPDSGWAFDHWVLDAVDVGTANPYSVTMDSNHGLEAVFKEVIPPTQYQLTISVSGSGTTDPTVGSYMYDEGTVVPATAYPASGWMLDYWLLDSVNVGNTNPYSVTMDADHTLEAVFVEISPLQYELTISVTGMGTTTPAPGTYPYDAGTEVEVTAVPDSGYMLDHWVLDSTNVGAANPYTVTMNADHTLTATFIQEQYILTINVSPEGSGTITPNNTGPYYYGDAVQLTAEPNTGWYFSQWRGDMLGSQNPATIIMDNNKMVTAVFTQGPEYTLTVNIVGSGTVLKDPDQASYIPDTVVTLTATPALGWSFSGWSGDLTGDESPATITMTSSKVVTATFTPLQYTLTLNVNGNGQIIKTPNQETYTYDTVVTLEAVPDAGWDFTGWSGDLSGSASSTTITIDGNKAVTASFTKIGFTLTINVVGSGSVTVSLEQPTYDPGTEVTLTANPALGWSFDGWSGDLSGSVSPTTITMDSNKVVTATFTEDQYTLDVTVVGNGQVAKNPDEAAYTYGTIVTLTATADPGWTFQGWSGDLSGSVSPTTITMTSDKAVIATFTQDQYTLTVNVEGDGSVTKNPDLPTYTYGAVVQLTANPEPDYAFSHWTGDISGNVNPEYITVTGNKVVTAVFVETQTNWWNTAWQYRRTIIIDHTKVSGTLTNFSLLIEIVDSNLINKAQPDGDDFVFTDASNNKLDHQIELYDNSAGRLIVWVKVPLLSSTADTLLYMYYGNPTCENQQNSTAVWDANYKLVLHLNENTGIHYDSTINGNNGTPYNGVVQGTTSKIDGGDTFDGSNDYAQVPHSNTLTGYTQAFTVSFWIRLGDTSRRQTILCKYHTSNNMRGWQIEYDPVDHRNNPFWFFASQNGITYSEWWASFVPSANTWYYVTIVWEANSTPKFYINGAQVPTIGAVLGNPISSIFNNTTPLQIGRSAYAGRYFKGSLDEIRISNIACSADRILTTYNNQLNPAEFCTVGAQETFE